MYKPPFSMTPAIHKSIADISRLVGRLEGLSGETPTPLLRKRNRIRTVHASVGIEGNTLTLDQVTAVLDGRRVLGTAQEIREVSNAITAYTSLGSMVPYQVSSLLQAHAMLMDNLVDAPGKFRTTEVGIFAGTKRRHVAPPASRVRGLVTDLFTFLRKDSATHPWVKAAVAHYELEFIHPFTDGNGRIGRLWHHFILVCDAAVFEYVPFESAIQRHQNSYYATLAECDRAGDATAFVAFSMNVLTEALVEYLKDFRPSFTTASDRLTAARQHFTSAWFTRKDYLALRKEVSSATASRDLAEGVADGQLQRSGDRSTTRYRFINQDKHEKDRSTKDRSTRNVELDDA